MVFFPRPGFASLSDRTEPRPIQDCPDRAAGLPSLPRHPTGRPELKSGLFTGQPTPGTSVVRTPIPS